MATLKGKAKKGPVLNQNPIFSPEENAKFGKIKWGPFWGGFCPKPLDILGPLFFGLAGKKKGADKPCRAIPLSETGGERLFIRGLFQTPRNHPGHFPAGSPVLNKQLCPYMVLLRMGFTMPGLSPDPRCALTAPFHPYQTVCLAVCFLWHFP
ncbi:MAG: hypothetical protein CM15mP100_1000 [Alphaproteobacteria bacterium]|nr:MAG: hypothetical protein CM15mP100_1000 [Alphaproteobacteria bacterium]